MPASLYPTVSNPAVSAMVHVGGNNGTNAASDLISSMMNQENNSNFDQVDSRAAAEQIALQLALLQQGQDHHHHPSSNGGGHHHQHHQHHHHHGGQVQTSTSDLLNGHGAGQHSGSLEDLKSSTQRRSQNMTECVPVPSSEHVSEMVGRQGCKIKALRAKTNTYIKTPVRGEEPVFVVTGRKEDVALAKREILSAADHFSQIRASRKSNINSTLAFGQLMANTPGQTTVQVRVPYRVVGLVVGPKGATIKRIQQQTHTYIVTPSRDKEPVFEVTGLPENVEAARKEIEAHIAIRTGNSSDFGGPNGGSGNNPASSSSNYFNLNENGGGNGSGGGSGGPHSDNDLFSTTSGGLNSPFSSSSGNLDHVNSILNSDTNGFASFKSSGPSAITLANLLSGSENLGHHRHVAWSNGTDSHDSGIGHSPPFDSNGSATSSAFKSDHTMNGIWGELNKVLGGLDLNGDHQSAHAGSNVEKSSFLSIGSRSSLDLGTLGRSGQQAEVNLMNTTTMTSTHVNNTANNSMGRQLSLPTETTPSSLPGFNGILSSTTSNQENHSETKDDIVSKQVVVVNSD